MSAAKRKKLNTGDSQPVITLIDPSIRAKANLLYEACFDSKAIGEEHSIAEMLAYGVVSSEKELGILCQENLNADLFVPYKKPNRMEMSYRLRSKADALKLCKLPFETKMVYNQIEGSGQNGIWKKTLVTYANLHENSITKAIKELMSKNLVKEFKTSKNTAKRMYILYNLEPSERSTGGTFYREGELDEGLVNVINDTIVNYVETKSWVEVASVPIPKGKETDKKKRKAEESKGDEKPLYKKPLYKVPLGPRDGPLVPQSANFKDYPNAEEITDWIESSQILLDINLSVTDIQQLVQQLVYDDRLEEIVEGKYRSVRRVWDRHREAPKPLPLVGPAEVTEDGFSFGNGLTQSPCGRCPVAKDCRIGGTVSPETCVYMEKWLGQLDQLDIF